MVSRNKDRLKDGRVSASSYTGAINALAKHVECCVRIGRKQGTTKSVDIDDAAELLDTIIKVIAEAQFVSPGLEDVVGGQIAKCSAKPTREHIVVGSNLIRTKTSFQRAIADASNKANPVYGGSRTAKRIEGILSRNRYAGSTDRVTAHKI